MAAHSYILGSFTPSRKPDGLGRGASLHRFVPEFHPFVSLSLISSLQYTYLRLAPSFSGDYPPIMREVMGSRLPAFNKAQSALLKGSTDFLGFDAYTSQWVTPTQGKCEYGDETWPRW